MTEKKMDVTGFSDIEYSVFEISPEPIADGENRKYRFDPLSGKIIASLMFRLRTVGRGKNIMTLKNSGGDELISIWCEGVCILAWDGEERKLIGRYRDNEWTAVWVSVDTAAGLYDVCIDGRKVLSCASLIREAGTISEMEAASGMGELKLKNVFLYRNPVQSVRSAAGSGNIYDVKDFGAIADGKTIVTKNIQNAIDRCSSDGGGIVYLHGGVFLSGSIELKEGTSLYLETDAELRGVTDVSAYPTMTSKNNPNWNMLKQGPQKALVFADGIDGIIIQGGGTINGSGNFPGDYGSESSRPSAVLLAGCNNARIQNIHFRDAGMWTIPLVECDSLYMRDVNIDSCWFPNRDGIDLCDCHDVLVENCFVTADDDALCFKSGHDRGCVNTTIRHMMISSVMANAVKFGTYSYGGFSDCTVRNCVIKDTRHAAIAVEIVDGGTAGNLRFEQIDISGSGSAFFILLGDRGNIPSWGVRKEGSINGIVFENIMVEWLDRNYGTCISGYESEGKKHFVRNILFRNVRAEFRGGVEDVPEDPPEYSKEIYPECDMFGILPASGFYIRHSKHVEFEGCHINVMEQDARQITFRI